MSQKKNGVLHGTGRSKALCHNNKIDNEKLSDRQNQWLSYTFCFRTFLEILNQAMSPLLVQGLTSEAKFHFPQKVK